MPAVVGASLRWLAGYRHERVCDDGVAACAARLSTTTPDVGYGSSSKDDRSAFRLDGPDASVQRPVARIQAPDGPLDVMKGRGLRSS
jgi:hypothetical protein